MLVQVADPKLQPEVPKRLTAMNEAGQQRMQEMVRGN